MLILALDTTSEKGGVGIYDGEKRLAVEENARPANTYSVTLFEMVDRALEAARLHLRDIELLVVANGPGSFTGIRVGVAAMQGWATAFGRPLVGVSTLEALVEEGRPESDGALALLDAHRGELYLGLFRRRAPATAAPCASAAGPPAYEQEGEGLVLKVESLAALLSERLPAGARTTCLVREHETAARGWRDQLAMPLTWQEVPGLLVGAMARLGGHAHRQGKIPSPAELDACYIRRPDAELYWKD